MGAPHSLVLCSCRDIQNPYRIMETPEPGATQTPKPIPLQGCGDALSLIPTGLQGPSKPVPMETPRTSPYGAAAPPTPHPETPRPVPVGLRGHPAPRGLPQTRSLPGTPSGSPRPGPGPPPTTCCQSEPPGTGPGPRPGPGQGSGSDPGSGSGLGPGLGSGPGPLPQGASKHRRDLYTVTNTLPCRGGATRVRPPRLPASPPHPPTFFPFFSPIPRNFRRFVSGALHLCPPR